MFLTAKSILHSLYFSIILCGIYSCIINSLSSSTVLIILIISLFVTPYVSWYTGINLHVFLGELVRYSNSHDVSSKLLNFFLTFPKTLI